MQQDVPLMKAVEAAYDAVVDPSGWPKALSRIAAMFDAPSAAMVVFAEDVRPLAAQLALDPSRMDEYVRHYHQLDIWRQAGTRLPPGSVVSGAELVPRRAFERSQWYNEFLRPQDVYHVLAGITRANGGFISVFRPKGADDFDQADKRLYGLILPHLLKALSMSRIFARAQVMKLGLEAALDRVSLGIIFVDEHGFVLAANAAGEAMMACGDGLGCWSGRIRAGLPADDEALAGLIREAGRTTRLAGAHPGGLLALRRRRGRALTVAVSPVPRSRMEAMARGAAAVLMVCDPDRKLVCDAAAVAQLFGLSPAEARLALALAQGLTLREAAECFGISLATARVQLREVFEKTGTRRQADLVRLMLAALSGISPRE